MRADLAELVQQGEAAQDRPVVDPAVAGDRGGVGEDGVAADHAVVRDVHVGHDPVVVADARGAAVLGGAAVDGAVLADGVAVADLEPGRLAVVLLVLRLAADGAEGEDPVVAADPGRALDHDVAADAGAVADLDPGSDHAEGTDADAAADARGGIDDRAAVDHASRPRSAHRISADATSRPSTVATQANRPMPRSMRLSATSRTSWSPGITVLEKRALSTLTR